MKMEIETIATPTTKEQRISSTKQIFWGTFLGGSLCGFYLIAQNYKALGYPKIAKKALATALVSIILFAAFIAFMVVSTDELNKPVIFFTYWGLNILGFIYLHYEHYKTLYDKNQLKQCLLALPFAVLLLASPLYLTPKSNAYFPSIIFPLTAILFQTFAIYYQKDRLKGLMENGIKKYSTRKLLGISAIALVLHLAIAFVIGFIIGFIAEII